MQNNLYKVISGYCEGYFGRDDYEDKIIILEGATWIVCRYINKDVVTCVNFDSEEEKQTCIDNWSRNFTEDDED